MTENDLRNTPSVVAPMRVLLAEDDERGRTALVSFLEGHGYEVTVVGDGQEAFERLMAPDPPQIALLDWEMPRLDGLHVCRAARTLPSARYTYIVMVTAHDHPRDVLQAFAAGVDDFLSKPVDSAQLLARLRSGERVLGLEDRLAQRIADLEHALEEVRQLKRLLPICTFCKKVRDDSDYWHEIESYLRASVGTGFAHGICPTCAEEALRQVQSSDPRQLELVDVSSGESPLGASQPKPV